MPGSGTYPALIGFDDQGREVLTYIPGESGRAAWTKVIEVAGLVAMGRLLRTYHDVVADYRPAGVAAGEVMCHGDFGPWNLVRHGVRPVGILDWDEARPARPVFDLAYALEYVVPFRDDDTCRRWLAYPAPPDRRSRLETFAQAYGTGLSVADLVDEVIAQQCATRARVAELAAAGHQPQAAWVAHGHLNELDARIHWSRTNRNLFSSSD